MSVADLVSRLIAAGTPPEVAAMVVTEAFALGSVCGHSADIPRTFADEQAERRRASDRERKRSVRRIPQNSADIPRTSEKVLTLTSLTNTNSKKEKKVRAAKAALSADWTPSDSHFEAAAKLGISRKAVEWKAEDLRLWALSSGELKLNWDATFHGFLRRDADKLRKFGATDEKLTVVEAARRNIEGNISFGPKPSLFPSTAGGSPLRVLSAGGSERPGGLHGSDSRDLVRIYTGSNPTRHGPTDGPASEDELPPDRARG